MFVYFQTSFKNFLHFLTYKFKYDKIIFQIQILGDKVYLKVF